MIRRIVLLSVFLIPTYSWAACVVIDIGSLTAQQRGKLSAAAHRIASPVSVRWLNGEMPATTQAAATSVELCATDVSGLRLAALTTHLGTIVSEQAVEDAASATADLTKSAAATEVSSNQLCTATLAQITSRLDAEEAAIQADINAATNIATAKIALSTLNTRFALALRQIARCVLARTIARE